MGIIRKESRAGSAEVPNDLGLHAMRVGMADDGIDEPVD